MNDAGFLDDRTVLAHQVHSTPEDLAIIKDRGVKIVHNPLANAVLGSGMPPLLRLLDLGIDVAVATDGCATADHQNMLAAGRLASQYQRAMLQDVHCLPAQKILEMLTIEPARMLGLEAGSLEVGRDADIILFDLSSPNMVPSTKANVIENLVWSSNGSEISHVIAGGVILLENRIFRTLDAPAVLRDMQQLAEEFLTRRTAREGA
jgi:5-methylthioadenosine/S-adenosylhomocysteine deaminase